MTEPDRITKDRIAVRWTVTACLVPALERHARTELAALAKKALVGIDADETYEAGMALHQLSTTLGEGALGDLARKAAFTCFYAAYGQDDFEIPTISEAAVCALQTGETSPEVVLAADGTPAWLAIELVELLDLAPDSE